MPDSTAKAKTNFTGHELRDLAILLALGAVLGVIGVALTQAGGYAAVGGICLLVGLAAFAVGSALGFIFGLPRVFSDDAQAQAKAAQAGTTAPPKKPLMKSNANLERVSDWLTTMIVGVALTQVLNIGKGLAEFQEFLKGLSSGCVSQTACHTDALAIAGPIVLVMATVAGFLFMYLYTRLVLTCVFDKVEDGLQNNLTVEATEKLISTQSSVGWSQASTRASVNQPLSVETAVQLMFSALYEDPPGGFEKVLQIAGVLSNSAATSRADYWFYQAAAFGQKLNWLRSARGAPDDLSDLSPDEQSALDNAIDAAHRAVRLDRDYKSMLKAIAQPAGVDDDMKLVIKDPRWPGDR